MPRMLWDRAQGFRVEVHFHQEGTRTLGGDSNGWHTTSEHSSTACRFDTPEEARKAAESAFREWIPKVENGLPPFTMTVVQIPGPTPPEGPRPTIWEHLLGDR